MNNPLQDALTPQVRKYLYAIAFVAGLAWTAWQAADGDWRTAVAAFIASIVPLLAHANVDAPDQVEGD